MKRFQVLLLIAILVTGLRVAYIFYERHEEQVQEVKKAAPPPLKADYYVTPRKLYPYDLKSAKQLTQQPVWVKVGYSITYFAYDKPSGRVNFAHEGGLLLPIERLDIKDVITAAAPQDPGERQVMAVFTKDGKMYAFSIGVLKDGEYHFSSDDMLFIQDPHELYKHWPADVWSAIDNHELKPGMNELQADFAVGLGIPEPGGDDDNKTVNYADGGKPLNVTYRDGKITEIKAGAS
ncbi:MAG: hypothetical protein JWO91_2402 [Acidobacteriaceae bacterium]|nr:hypothetical protein [Acidobacteriaceae bacterium]